MRAARLLKKVKKPGSSSAGAGGGPVSVVTAGSTGPPGSGPAADCGALVMVSRIWVRLCAQSRAAVSAS